MVASISPHTSKVLITNRSYYLLTLGREVLRTAWCGILPHSALDNVGIVDNISFTNPKHLNGEYHVTAVSISMAPGHRALLFASSRPGARSDGDRRNQRHGH